MMSRSQVGGTVRRLARDVSRSAGSDVCRCKEPVPETITNPQGRDVTFCHVCNKKVE